MLLLFALNVLQLVLPLHGPDLIQLKRELFILRRKDRDLGLQLLDLLLELVLVFAILLC